MALVKFQLGKAGLTDEFIAALKLAAPAHRIIKINLLKNSTRDKEETKKIAEEIKSKMETAQIGYNTKIIGFTLVLMRYKKSPKK